MNNPVIILGAGGHAKVLIDALRLRSLNMLGLTDADPAKTGQMLMGITIIGSDSVVATYPATTIGLVNGLGAVRVGHHRKELFERFKSKGYRFINVIHPFTSVASDAVLSEGVQIMAGAVVQAGCTIGENVIINTRAVVDHDCRIGSGAHIAPGAILSGGVDVGDNALVGAGATVIQGVCVGRNSLVAAGAVVIRDVPEGATVGGVPAKEMKP